MPDEYFKKYIKELIDAAVFYKSSQNCGYRKPYGHILINAAKQHDQNTRDLIYIGDKEKDRLTAFNNGCCFILNQGAINDLYKLYLKCIEQ